MKYEHLRDEIIFPSLKLFSSVEPKINSETAVNLLVGIAAQESRGGYYLRQTNGPALGIYQIEPATMQDLFDNYLFALPRFREIVLKCASGFPGSMARENDLVHNLQYSTVIARLLLWRHREPLPDDPNDIWALGAYWKKYWNTEKGKGTVEQFVDNYERYTNKGASYVS